MIPTVFKMIHLLGLHGLGWDISRRPFCPVEPVGGRHTGCTNLMV